MQIWKGKAWEIWSHVVISGRPMVDTYRVVPNEESQRSETLPGTVSPRTGGQGIYKVVQYCLFFTMPGTGQHKTGIIMVGHHPPCVYLQSTWRHYMHVMISPRPSPLCICILQAIKDGRWE